MTRQSWLYAALIIAVLLGEDGDEPTQVWFGYTCLRCQEMRKGAILPR